MDRRGEMLVRLVLGLTGLVALVTGINVGFGGIMTLGLEGPRDFIEVRDAADYAVHDSHTRFFAGLWVGLGLLFLAAAARWLDQLRAPVMLGLGLVFVGGLFRLSQPGLGGFASPAVIASFTAEMLLMPVLIWRIWAGRQAA